VKKNPMVAEGLDFIESTDRDVDEMARRAEVFSQLWSEYFDSYGAKYEISYGVRDDGDVTIIDDNGEYETRVPSFFEVVIFHSFADRVPPEGETEQVGDRFLKESRLDEFLYYDGWERGPDGMRNFWYEHYKASRLYSHEGFEAQKLDVQVAKLKKKLLR